jgi:hypothetical protein
MKRLYLLLALVCLSACAGSPSAQNRPNFASAVLAATREFPSGGGYDGSHATKNLLVRSARPGETGITFDLEQARPSFCSSATYLVFLQATQATTPVSTNLAQTLAVRPNQKDGHGVFGRWNANGPGAAKLIADLDCGINFTSWNNARPGDFLKIWWSDAIGGREHGHHVVYLSHNEKTVTFWSSNQPNGYGKKTILRAKCHRVLFTRITKPNLIAKATQLPSIDPWLADMLHKDFTWEEVVRHCQVQSTP